MVTITEADNPILDKIKICEGGKINEKMLTAYVNIRRDIIKKDYELEKKRISLKNQILKNERNLDRDRYNVAKMLIHNINITSKRRDNYIRFLSLLLLFVGGSISYVCYKNTENVHRGLEDLYSNIYLHTNTSYIYERYAFDENIYILGYVSGIANFILHISLSIFDLFHCILLSIIGILIGISEVGSVAISGSIAFVVIVFTMLMMKLMTSDISIGWSGTHIREGIITDSNSEKIDNVLGSYLGTPSRIKNNVSEYVF